MAFLPNLAATEARSGSVSFAIEYIITGLGPCQQVVGCVHKAGWGCILLEASFAAARRHTIVTYQPCPCGRTFCRPLIIVAVFEDAVKSYVSFVIDAERPDRHDGLVWGEELKSHFNEQSIHCEY